MFPYSDNLNKQKGFYGVVWLIAIMAIINVPIYLDKTFGDWAFNYLSFVPFHFSLHPWLNLYTLITSIFVHGDVFHLFGNCLFFWVFGRSLERLFGTTLFMIIFPFLGMAGLILHWILNADSKAPVIGASGAIATLMGAYLVLFPKARMKMIFILGVFFKRFSLPAWMFLFYWGGLQLLSLACGSASRDHVAYSVHVGGFMIGAILAVIWKVSYPYAEERLTVFTEDAFQQRIISVTGVGGSNP
jgi:membrane associated rhomboid family serine protease